MKAIVGMVAGLSLLGSLLQAQEQKTKTVPEKPPLPALPLLHRAADQSRWTIDIDHVPDSKETTPTGASPERATSTMKPSPRSISVTKSGKIYEEIEIDEEGKRLEKWNVNGIQVSFMQDKSKWILADGGVASVFYTDYAKHDFPDFFWISPKNYVAFSKVGGVDCYVFSDEIRFPESPAPIQVNAAIDSTTLLPVSLDIGGTKQVYKFGSPPSTPLTVPENVQAIITERQNALAPLLRRPGQR